MHGIGLNTKTLRSSDTPTLVVIRMRLRSTASSRFCCGSQDFGIRLSEARRAPTLSGKTKHSTQGDEKPAHNYPAHVHRIVVSWVANYMGGSTAHEFAVEPGNSIAVMRFSDTQTVNFSPTAISENFFNLPFTCTP
jgi:hypothetical protein